MNLPVKLLHQPLNYVIRLSFALLLSMLLLPQQAQAQPSGFTDQVFIGGWNQVTGLTFDVNGRMYAWEKSGKVWVVENGSRLPNPLIDISEEVGNWRDFGLVGFALDPDFLTNGYIYLLYVVDLHHLLHFGTGSYDPNTNEYFDAAIGRITRYTAEASTNFTTVDYSSRQVLFGETASTGMPSLHQSHGVGALVFGTDGTLLATLGDGASYSSVDEGSASETYYQTALNEGIIRPDENVGAYRVQKMDSFNGKIIRIDPATGDGLSSNPFYDAANPRSAASRTWALGVRNPYRIALRPETGSHNPDNGQPGDFYFGDVGWGTREELNVIDAPGLNFGWPKYEGMTFQPGYDNPLYAPSSHELPKVDWRNTTPRVYKNGSIYDIGSAQFPGPYFEGNASTGGIWYTGDDFPASYKNTYFHADYGAGWILNMSFDANNEPLSVEQFIPSTGAVVGVATSPTTGGLYYISYPSEIRKVSYAPAGNQPPVVDISANPEYGAADLLVQFTGDQSYDPEGGSLSFDWDFGDGSVNSDIANPAHLYTATPGTPTTYTVTLTVTDVGGATAQGTFDVFINNTPPVIQSTSIDNINTFNPSTTTNLTLTATVTDAEHSASQLSYAWQTSLFHNDHSHAEPIDNNPSTSTQISPIGCDGVTYWYKVELTVTDPEGLSSTFIKDIYPDCSGSSQSISFNSIPDKSTTDADFTISASASSGLPVALYVVEGPATIIGNTVSLLGTPGEVVIRAVQGGNGTYVPAIPVERSFQVIYSPPGSGGCSATGQISREVWQGVTGTSVSQIPLGTPPDIQDLLTIFEIPVDADDNYGTRVRGYICPPTTGAYTFWISSDDNGELWLSTDDQENNKVLIGSVPAWTESREWDKFPEQQSSAINLVAGQRYYIEALQKEQGGGDNLAVGWQLPGGTLERPIPGSYLTPWGSSGNDVSQPAVTLSTASTNVTGPFSVIVNFSEPVNGLSLSDFTVSNGTASALGGSGQNYSFTLTPLANGSVSVQLPAATVSDPAGNDNTASNTLLVNYTSSDNTPPTVTLSTASDPVSGPFTVDVTFSEPISGLTLSDFNVTNGSKSNLSGSGSVFSFTISPTTAGTVTAHLPANRVDDLAGNGNEASNTLSITYDPTPPCDNVTSGGTIAGDESVCGSYDPALITNVSSPSGGSGSLEYRWQQSTNSAGGPWNTISGASSATYNPSTITQSTWYRRQARRAGCTSYDGVSNIVFKEVQTNCGGGLPTGYCASRGDAPWWEWIEQVDFGDISHNSGKNGYADNTNLQTDIEQGGVYPISVDPGLSWSGHITDLYWRIWIDFNRDGDFEDSGELVLQDQTTSAGISGNLLVPANASIGLARMRISMKKDAYADPCEQFPLGEVEDFAVNILPSSGGGNCFITATPSNVQCSDNGTSNDPSDDTYTFDVTVVGINTGSGWTGGGGSGNYNQAVSFGPYPIAGGATSFQITDNDDAGCTDDITVAAPPSCSNAGEMPDGYCSSGGSAPWTEWIGRVLFRSIDHSSGKNGYADFTTQSTSVVQGANYPITLEPGLSWPGHIVDLYWRVWIDFNRDGDFNDAGELVVADNAVSATINATVQIPSGASIGAARMRVSMQKDFYADPCESFEFGEVEDYKVIIVSSNGQDVTPPDVTLSTPLNTVDGPFGVTVTFTENVTGLSMSDFTITNGSGSGFNGSGSSYAFTVTPAAAGSVSIQLPAGRAFDAAGNGNTASNTLNVTYNPPPVPTVIITGPQDGALLFGTSVNVTYATSGDLAGNNATHLLLTLDGQPPIDIHNMTGSYTLSNVPFGSHTLVAELADDSHIPLSNPEASDQISFTTQAQGAGPTVSLTTASTDVNGPFTVNIDFSASVSGFTINDIVVTNATLSNPAGAGANYSVTVNPLVEGIVTIAVPADVATDGSGNGNQASSTLSVNYTELGGPNNYCASSASEPWHEWIGNVSFANINHDSGKNGYGDFTGTTANVVAGSSYPISVTPYFSYTHWDEYVRVWIDYNADGDFEDSGELVFSDFALAGPDGGGPGNVLTGNISIPSTATVGATRMRVSMQRGAYADPCESFVAGEVEDYSVVIGSSVAGSNNGFSSNGQEMLMFQARIALRRVDLEWLTNTEYKNEYFIVERSADGSQFLPLREVSSANGGYQLYRYEQVDDQPLLGANYYRLKLVMEDGNIRYSDVQQVQFDILLDEVALFPNPTTNELYINLRKWAGRSAVVQIYDSEAVLMLEMDIDAIAKSPLRMDVSSFVNGFYTLTVKAEGQPRYTSNFIINRLY